jgi:hypothetical protein
LTSLRLGQLTSSSTNLPMTESGTGPAAYQGQSATYHGALMNSAPRLARRRGGRAAGRDAHWRVLLVIGGFALAAVVLTRLALGRGSDAGVSSPPGQATAVVRTADAPIILTGIGSQTTDPFYLAGGTYRSDWSAWGEAPEYPPCTHSAELMAVDPANAETSLGHVTNLAKLVQVPATGASATSYVYNVKPGDYFLDVDSACGWQIALSPT